MKYCYSDSDDGVFCGECVTVQDAIHDAHVEYGHESNTCFVGESKTITWTDALGSYWLDRLIEIADENLGDILPGECFPVFENKEVEAARPILEALIIEKLAELLPIKKYTVDNVKRYSFADYGLTREGCDHELLR